MPERTDIPLIESFTLGPFATNCYLLHDPGAGAGWIIDAGIEPTPMIRRARDLGLRIEKIILTHAHADHIAGLAEVREAFPDAPILLHAAESRWPSDPNLNLSGAMGQPLTAPDADTLLKGGETLSLGETDWRVLHTPGHSPGGVTLYSQAAATALAGDTLFAGSIGRFDFPTSDGPALFASIRDILYALPPETRILPGHGQETTIGAEMRSNPFVRAEGHSG